jgi:hypothetical protein
MQPPADLGYAGNLNTAVPCLSVVSVASTGNLLVGLLTAAHCTVTLTPEMAEGLAARSVTVTLVLHV